MSADSLLKLEGSIAPLTTIEEGLLKGGFGNVSGDGNIMRSNPNCVNGNCPGGSNGGCNNVDCSCKKCSTTVED